MDRHVLDVLAAGNSWMFGVALDEWYGRFLPTDYVQRSTRLGPGDEAVRLVVGPRQSGKSTLVWKTIADTGEAALFVNCEEPSIREWARSPTLFASDVAGAFPDLRHLFLEEVQHLGDAGLFLKGLHDRKTGWAIYATGSSSFHLESATRESLAGRAGRHLLLPFSIEELGARFAHLPPGGRQRQLALVADKLALLGGYPTVQRAERPELELARLVEAFVLRDASDRFRIRHVAAFRKVLELAAGHVGSLCNFSEWASVSGASADAVRDYVQILENSHVLRLVRPFVGGKRAEITGAPKCYFLDNGYRNRLCGGFEPLPGRADRGQVVENLVFTELAKTVHPILDSIRYWRSKAGAEVDFVVEHAGRILPVEVKASEGPVKVTRSMHSFIDAYRPKRFLVATLAGSGSTWVGETELRQVEIPQLAAEVRDWFGHVE